MLGKEPGPQDSPPAEPVPSARAVSVRSALPITYGGPTTGDRRSHAFVAMLVGFVALAVAVAPHMLGLNGWIVAAAGLSAVALGGVAWHQAPWLGSFGRISASLGMTMGLAAATLMLYPFL
jgi:hypothetical protein